MPLRDQLQSIFNLTPNQRLGEGVKFGAFFDSSLSTITPHTGRREALSRLYKKSFSAEGLMFPEDIIQAKYHMRFDFAPYRRTDPFTVDVINWVPKIWLPMPENINDSVVLNYDTTDLGPIWGAKVTDSARNEALQEFGASVGAVAGKQVSKAVEAIAGAGAEERAGQDLGYIINPHSSVVFRGIQLKSHTFSWKLSPKNAVETKNIRAIIQQFKLEALPVAFSGAFMGYPNLCAPHYIMDGLENPFLPIFQEFPGGTPTAITNIGISYTPDGGSSFLRNGSPVALMLNIEVRELEIKYRDGVTGRIVGGETGPGNDTGGRSEPFV